MDPVTFPKGLLGVLRTRTLVRGVNLLASSVGSSCQSLLDPSCPLGVGLCRRRWEGQRYLLSSPQLISLRTCSHLSSLSSGLHLYPPSSEDSLPYVPGVPQPTHAHPGSLASLCLHITTQHSLPASGTETQGDLQPSLSWVRNNQKQAL